MKTILQITPALPPSINGVGDYAFHLAKLLKQDHEINTQFIVAGVNSLDSNFIKDFPVFKLSNHFVEALLEQLERRVQSQSDLIILLHYVGYGYAKRGCPFWLVEALAQWKVYYPKSQLVTMFHEVAASGPPWTSAFWLSGVQQKLAKRLVQISDRILTSKRSYAELLQSYAPEQFTTIPSLPVFSTVGELQTSSNLSERTRRLVIFGGRSKRTKVYKNSLEQLEQICRYLGIQQIFDIGPPLESLPANVNTVPITTAGCLNSEVISTILSDSIAGFFSYNPKFLGKSTIFAAYCAHRVIPISATITDISDEGLQPGRHYAIPSQYNSDKRDMALMQAIADNAYSWYQTHNLSCQALAFSNLIKSVSG